MKQRRLSVVRAGPKDKGRLGVAGESKSSGMSLRDVIYA
jgi:hypothetical protein